MEGKLLTITISIPKPSRRWFQFSLATIILLTVFAGTWLGLVGQRLWRPAQRAVTPGKTSRWAAKEAELASIIRYINGIQDATVTFDNPRSDDAPNREAATAVVSVTRQGQVRLNPKQVDAITNLVAGSFAGLSRENVTVLGLSDNVARRVSEKRKDYR